MTKSELQLNVTTWTTRSQVQEFDREDIQFHTSQKFKISESKCFVTQNSLTYKFNVPTSKEECVESDQMLFKVINENETHISIKPLCLTIYQVISSKLDAKYVELKQGDKFKFGKKKIQVIHVGMYTPKLQLSKNYEANNIVSFETDFLTRNSNTLLSEDCTSNDKEYIQKCRFCLGQSRSSENPLLKCCGCKGISNYLHLNCLKEWIKTKSTKGVHKAGINYYVSKKSLQCQVCHVHFDFKVSIPLLLDIQLNQYILFEDEQYLYVTYCRQKDCLTIGRSNNSQIQLSQNTVSRSHAEIFYEPRKNKFYIRDLKSKFGSLKELKSCRVEDVLDIQVGRNIFKLRRIPKTSFFSKLLKFCSREEISYIEDQKKGRLMKKLQNNKQKSENISKFD